MGLSNPVMLVNLAALKRDLHHWATVLDARRATALMRAHGARVRQVSRGLAVAQVLAALPGAVIGVPLGLGLFKVATGNGGGTPDVLWLVAATFGTSSCWGASLASQPASARGSRSSRFCNRSESANTTLRLRISSGLDDHLKLRRSSGSW